MKIGILYPRSAAYPAMGMEFMDGFKTCLKNHHINNTVTIITENAGYGGVDKEVKEKIEKLLLEDAEILILYIDLKIVTLVKPLLEASGKLVMIINPGADYPQTWFPSPNIIHLTLNQAFLCWLTGHLAFEENNTTGVMATSFYDCGYLHSTLMVNAFTANGGNIVYNYVNNQLYNENFHINELSSFLEANPNTRKLLCIYDSLPAALFYKQLHALKQAEQLQLYVSPMMLEAKALENSAGSFSFSINGYSPWIPNSEEVTNREFIQLFTQQNKTATIFSLLGWEAGLVLQEVLSQSDVEGNTVPKVDHLYSHPINSPRGKMTLDKGSHFYIAPIVKCSLKEDEKQLITQILHVQDIDWNTFMNNQISGVVSGWTNTYLCY